VLTTRELKSLASREFTVGSLTRLSSRENSVDRHQPNDIVVNFVIVKVGKAD
jgi:hypothetical protein